MIADWLTLMKTSHGTKLKTEKNGASPKKEVVGGRRMAAVVEQSKEVMVLTVNVPCACKVHTRHHQRTPRIVDNPTTRKKGKRETVGLKR